jgi:hypothetical protein
MNNISCWTALAIAGSVAQTNGGGSAQNQLHPSSIPDRQPHPFSIYYTGGRKSWAADQSQ